MSRTIVAVGTLLLVLAVGSTTQAEGFWPNLNPFAAKKPSSPYRVTDSKSNSWWPSWGQSSAPRGGPTTWQKVQAAPGKMYNKTKETLSPLNPFKSQPTKKTSYLTTPKKEEPTGFWPNWMTVEEKNESKPLSVSDFINQKKPGDE